MLILFQCTQYIENCYIVLLLSTSVRNRLVTNLVCFTFEWAGRHCFVLFTACNDTFYGLSRTPGKHFISFTFEKVFVGHIGIRTRAGHSSNFMYIFGTRQVLEVLGIRRPILNTHQRTPQAQTPTEEFHVRRLNH